MKSEKYSLLVEQIKALIEGERDVVAVMANVVWQLPSTRRWASGGQVSTV